MNKPGFATKIIAVLFLIIVGTIAVINFDIFRTPFQNFAQQKSPTAFTKDVANAYRTEMRTKNAFITLNGVYARISGNRVSNEVILMKDGSLTSVDEGCDPTYGVEQLVALEQYLQDRDTPFLYIQAPRKPDINNDLLPTGTVNKTNDTAGQAVAQLQAADIEVIDMRPTLLADEESIRKYYYRTDHHWNAEGAFVAYEMIAQYLQAQFPEQTILGETTDRNAWELHTRKNFFLGSHGRRVGIGFAGLDDLIYLTPKFDTDLSCSVPSKRIFRRGPFAQSALDTYYMTGAPAYYNSSPYCIHTGSDYAHVQFRNEKAPSDLKVLLIKESFGLPVEGFLSTTFQQVDTLDLDLRNSLFSSAVEKIESFDPDIVMVMYNGMVYSNYRFFDFGIEEYEPTPYKMLFEGKDYPLTAQPGNNSLRQTIATVESGKTYTITVDSIVTTGNHTDCVSFILFDPANNKPYDAYYVDLAYIQNTGGKTRWVFTVPQVEGNQLDLIACPSVPGMTDGIGAEFIGVSLCEGISE